MHRYYSFAEDYPSALHIEELARLMEELQASGALLPQMCRWRLRAVASEPIVRHGYWGGELHLVRASYKCGCWIEWQDLRGRVAPLPPRSDALDEFAFAEEHLGALEAEHACAIHGGPFDSSPDDDDSWWTPARCLAYGGHHPDATDACDRCGAQSEKLP